ncbi:uncharacterized protein I303_108658 [Kwoniella dejecticola CBS 10117]|uniref:RRM domain-containing protein n=1 Tax=Kwoniella dejecticola CBS 10117 TaxID=1296121 RepID=A0AAJ8ML11_9TREE
MSTDTDASLPSPPPSSDKHATMSPNDNGEDIHEGKDLQDPTPRVPDNEIRLYGLNPAVNAENLINFFSSAARVLGVLLHPQSTSSATLQWAQLWVGSQAEVAKCMDLKHHLAPSGITLSKAPSSSATVTTQGLLTPELANKNSLTVDIRAPPTPPSLSRVLRTDTSGLGYRHIDPQGPLPRNLYVMGLPLDLTQVQFKTLFSQFGMVEHSTLLSQLDGMGRRRGFILMSTHKEAVEAMQNMNGTWLEGFKIDISWALVQRDSRTFGAVIHPPSVPSPRDLSDDCSVLVENLDPVYFPNAGAVREIFSTFGPVIRVSIVSVNPFQAVIYFEHEVSATALLDAHGLSLGGRPVHTRRYIKPSLSNLLHPVNGGSSSPLNLPFDPFSNESDVASRLSRVQLPTRLNNSGVLTPTSLNANSAPFVPLPYSNTRWLSSSANKENIFNNHEQMDSPTTLQDTSSEAIGSSDSTKYPKANGIAGAKLSVDNEKGTNRNNHKVWPLPSEATSMPVPAKSRWNSAPK